MESGEFASISASLQQSPQLDEPQLAQLRRHYPALRFNLCSEDDLPEREPYLRCQGFDIHLLYLPLAGCGGLTGQLSCSNGLLIALHSAW